MDIPLLDLKKQYISIKNEIDSAIQDVLDSQRFILGEQVQSLEQNIASLSGTVHAVGVASGTDALLLSLKACGIGKGEDDLVITTPFTFFATAGAVVNAGACPVFVDIKPDTYNIDPCRIKEFLEHNPDKRDRVRAVIPVHLYGQMADMDEIMNIAQEYGLTVIEDGCQSIGAEYNGAPSGSFGTTGAVSFFPSKNLGGYGDGGMIVTDDTDITDRLRRLRVHGSGKKYYHQEVGLNSRLDALQAAVLNVKATYLEQWNARRREIADIYTNGFNPISEVIPPVTEKNRKHVFHQYTLRVPAEHRDGLKKHLKQAGVSSNVYYPLCLHKQECFSDVKAELPVSEKAAKEVLSLPVYPELSREEIEYIIEQIKAFFK